MSVTRAIKWICYSNEGEARDAFNKLRNVALAGPGEIQLRHYPYARGRELFDMLSIMERAFPRPKYFSWWVLLYDVVWSLSPKMAEIYGYPRHSSWDSWSEYEGGSKIRQTIGSSTLIDRFVVEASEDKILEFKKLLEDNDLIDYIFACPHQVDEVKCDEEIDRRLMLLRIIGSLEYDPLDFYKAFY